MTKVKEQKERQQLELTIKTAVAQHELQSHPEGIGIQMPEGATFEIKHGTIPILRRIARVLRREVEEME